MAYQFPPDVQQHLSAWLASGKYGSEDDVLRDALRALADEQQDADSIQEALDEWEAGDPGIPARVALEELRERHRIPSGS